MFLIFLIFWPTLTCKSGEKNDSKLGPLELGWVELDNLELHETSYTELLYYIAALMM